MARLSTGWLHLGCVWQNDSHMSTPKRIMHNSAMLVLYAVRYGTDMEDYFPGAHVPAVSCWEPDMSPYL